MLLGIALHGAISFFPVGIWPGQDIHQPEVAVPAQLVETLGQAGLESPRSVNLYEMVMHAIHGFRLPLFFLVSGFFTAMLWKNRGLKQLAKHRAKRILLPLVIFVPITWILIIPVGIYGSYGYTIQYLPESIYMLDNLDYLNLSDVGLVEFPSTFGNLPSLTSLDVWRNNLTDDSFPESMNNLVQLYGLSLDGNQLTRFPDFIQYLSNSIGWIYFGYGYWGTGNQIEYFPDWWYQSTFPN